MPDERSASGGEPAMMPVAMAKVRNHQHHVSGTEPHNPRPGVRPRGGQGPVTFLGITAGQIGTAFAVRTQRVSLRSVGVFSNRYLLAGIAAEIVLVALFVYTPPMQTLLGTAPLPPSDLLLLLPYPFMVWGADELRRGSS